MSLLGAWRYTAPVVGNLVQLVVFEGGFAMFLTIFQVVLIGGEMTPFFESVHASVGISDFRPERTLKPVSSEHVFPRNQTANAFSHNRMSAYRESSQWMEVELIDHQQA